MAQKTALQPYGLPGQVRTFSAKTAAVTTAIHILSTGAVSPLHASDSGDNLLLAGVIEIQGVGWVEGVFTVKGIADGGRTNYDLRVGDTSGTPTYGIIQMGNSIIGRTSFKAGNLDLDGVVLIQNVGGAVTSQIEFCFAESGGNTTRFALPKSGVGNATYNPRSMLLAGPAPADTDFVTVGYWQTNESIFDNLACDTVGSGADLGVQHDLEVENDTFCDSLKESTTDAGITIGHKLILVSGRIINRTSVTSSPYTVLASDEHISVTTASVAITLNLPAIINGTIYHFKDQDGNSTGNNITLSPNGAETIENAASLVINTKGASITLVGNSTTSNWEIQ